jgi:hypothetical protein
MNRGMLFLFGNASKKSTQDTNIGGVLPDPAGKIITPREITFK